MIDLYTWNTPNGRKATIMLEECGLEYNLKPINIREEEQKQPDYLKVNPNGRIPALFDHESGARVFESGAMLVYLAEKTGMFLPQDPVERAEILGWTFWQVGGLGPMLGQYGHFSDLDEDIPYALERYRDESIRLLSVLDKQLQQHNYLGRDYSIADMMNYSWALMGMNNIGKSHPEMTKDFTAIKEWLERIGKRAAVQTGVGVLSELSQSRY